VLFFSNAYDRYLAPSGPILLAIEGMRKKINRKEIHLSPKCVNVVFFSNAFDRYFVPSDPKLLSIENVREEYKDGEGKYREDRFA
jgi:hypothetical protein